MTSSTQLPGAPVKCSLSGAPASGQPQLEVAVLMSSFSEAQGAQVSGLARLDMLEQGDGYCFRAEQTLLYIQKRECLGKDDPAFDTSCMALQLLGAILLLTGSVHTAHSTNMATVNIPLWVSSLTLLSMRSVLHAPVL